MAASLALDSDALAPVRRRSATHVLTLAFVWLVFAVSGIVFTEPAPYDALMLGLIVLLPLVRLADLTPRLALFLMLWLAVAAGAYIATTQAVLIDVAAKHATVTLFLALSGVAVAAFVVVNPPAHARLILSGYTFAAVIATAAAIIGYFDLVPGAYDLFTKYSRARGTFEDPNVYGPFIVPILIWAVHGMATGGLRKTLTQGLLLAYLLFGLLLTFSRGAWVNALLAMAVYGYFAFVTARTNRKRLKLIAMAGVGALFVVSVIAAGLSIPAVAELYQQRAALELGYDAGPEGRFGGQLKAIDVIMHTPLGVGPLEFGRFFHHEDAHNVYLTVFLDCGWLGGIAFLMLTLATLAIGVRCALRATPLQDIAVVLLAAFVGLAGEGLVVDTYHWRHFFVVMGLIWALAAANARHRRLPA